MELSHTRMGLSHTRMGLSHTRMGRPICVYICMGLSHVHNYTDDTVHHAWYGPTYIQHCQRLSPCSCLTHLMGLLNETVQLNTRIYTRVGLSCKSVWDNPIRV